MTAVVAHVTASTRVRCDDGVSVTRQQRNETWVQLTFASSGLYKRLLHEATRVTRSLTDAEDVVHDCLIKALESERDGNHLLNLGAWLTTAVRHRSIDAVRSRQRRQSQPMELGSDDLELTRVSEDASSVAPHMLEQALAAMPATLREIIELRYVEQLSYRELSERLNLTADAVGTRLHRARTLLRETLT